MNEHRELERGDMPATAVCPAWCAADHEHQGAESDRWHHSLPVELPLVELARTSGAGMTDVALLFDVALEQPWDSPSTYVMFGVGSERARTFCVTVESAERLVVAMQSAVRLARKRA